MADIVISPLVETWKIANLTNFDFGLVDVPGLNSSTSLPKMVGGVPQWFNALDYTTADLLAVSDTFRNALISAPPTVGTEGYKHTHEGLYDTVAAGVALPDASTWHSHSGLEILTGGITSDADSLHTHDSFITDIEVDTLISTAIGDIDLSGYVEKNGSVSQLLDITSDGETIETAIGQAHDQDHSLLNHIDDVNPFIMANFRKLLDGSNADCCHTHAGTTGTFDGEHNDLDGLNDDDYVHLTAVEYVNFGTLTDGSNADALHTHIGEGAFEGDHNELDGLQGGSFSINPSLLEYYHLNYDEYIALVGGPSNTADDYHTHGWPTSADELSLGTPTDGSWIPGIITSWTSSTLTADAIDDLNETMNYLAPDDAGSMDGDTLTTNGVSTYTGRLSDGNTNYPGGFAIGSTYTRIINDGTFSILSPNQSTTFNKADEGVMRYYINGVEDDSVDLAANFVEGERGGTQSTTPWTGGASNLSVTLVTWYNSFPAWQRGNATMTVVPGDLRQGYNYFDFKHDLDTDQDTATLKFFYDNDAGSNPSISVSTTVVENTKVTKWLSGIDHYYRASTFDMDATAIDCFDNVYHQTSSLTYTSTSSTMGSGNIDYDDGAVSGMTGAGGFPLIGDTMTVNNKLITVPNSNVRSINARATVTPRDPYGSYSGSQSGSENRLVDAYVTTSTVLYEYFDDENRRLTAGAYDSIPGSITGVWTSSNTLVDGNVQVFNGRLYYPTINFNSGYLPSQSIGDYSAFSGDQVYYRAFYDSGIAHSNGSLEFGNLSGNGDIDPVGTGDINVEIKLSTQTGWLDLGTAYNVATFSGVDGDGCRNGDASGNDFPWICGTKSTANSGYMIIVKVTFRNNGAKYISQIRELGW